MTKLQNNSAIFIDIVILQGSVVQNVDIAEPQYWFYKLLFEKITIH